jgi:hypothetical protein
MIDEKYVIIAAAINIAAAIGYAIETLRGHNQPNRVTWLLWGLAPVVAAAVQFFEGVGWPALTTLSFGLGPFIILAASFANRQAYWRIGRLDYLCGALSALALILWAITQTGLLALVLMILTDVLAGIPTVVKAYRRPETETSWAYGLTVIAAAITLFTIDAWTFVGVSFAVYVLCMSGALWLIIRFPRFLRTK